LNKKPKINFNHIKKLIEKERINFNDHGRQRSIQRNITIDQAIYAILNGKIVETHEEIMPCPTATFECNVDGRLLTVVIAQGKYYIDIITVY